MFNNLVIAGKNICVVVIIFCLISYFLGVNNVFKNREVAEKKICVSEDNYEREMEGKILPFINQVKTTGYLKTFDGVNLFYEKFVPENFKSVVVMVHGFSENTQRYGELIYYFLKQSCAVYIYDQRGHGFSDRLIENKNVVYVKNFDDYAHDLKNFFDQIVFAENKIPIDNLFLFGHSMGGAVITRFMQIYQPKNLKLVILSAPMFEIKLTRDQARTKDLVMQKEDNLEQYLPEQKNDDPKNKLHNPIYKDYPRYIYTMGKEIENPELIVDVASFAWLKQAFKVTNKIFEPECIEKINQTKTKILLFQYENDETVGADSQNQFDALVKNCELCKINDSQHNIYFMHSDVFDKFLNKIFLNLD